MKYNQICGRRKTTNHSSPVCNKGEISNASSTTNIQAYGESLISFEYASFDGERACVDATGFEAAGVLNEKARHEENMRDESR